MSGEHWAVENSWGEPFEAAPTLLDAMFAEGRPGLRLWAPPTVALDQRPSLPVHLGVFDANARIGRLALLDRAIVVAVELTTGRAHAARVDRTGGGERPVRLVPPPGFEGGLGPTSGARAAQVTRFALWNTATASPPFAPGRFRLTVIAADHVSNDVVVEVTRSMTTVDPAIVDDKEREATAHVSPPPDPAGNLPRYHFADDLLSPPVDRGVILEAGRVATARDVCTLRGAARARRPGAIVPVTLVVTGSEIPGPHVVPMRVPSFDRDAAQFAVDLLRLAPLAAAPQTYFVYAFTADGHAGPLPIAVVAG
jgi:hypothetical protein